MKTAQSDDFLSILTFAALEFTALTLALAFIVALLCLAMLELILRAVFTRIVFATWRSDVYVDLNISSYWLPYRQFCGQVLNIGLSSLQRNERRLHRLLDGARSRDEASLGLLEFDHDTANHDGNARHLEKLVDSSASYSELIDKINQQTGDTDLDVPVAQITHLIEHELQDTREESEHFEHRVNALQRSLGTVLNFFNYIICLGIAAFVVMLIAQSPRAADNALGPSVFSLGQVEIYVLAATAIVSGTIAPLIVQILERRLLQR